MDCGDPFDLQRFVDAQDRGDTFERALTELVDGRKTSHWMWFVFPQIAGLGHSQMARAYAIESLEEAQAYLDHLLLGTRLLQCCRVLLMHEDRSAQEILGEVDAVKLRSSMTLFSAADPDQHHFQRVLDRYYDGVPDAETERLISQ